MMQNTIRLLLTGFLFLFSNKLFTEEIAYKTDQHQLNSAQKQEFVVQWARDHLPQVGVLTEEKRGYVYLKVEDGYIHQLFSKLPQYDHREYTKPQYFRRSDSPGAHISVFYVDERKQTGEIKEIGQKYSFKITGLATVPPKTHEYIVLEVESPDLEQLRKKYGLSPLLHGHKFHITIAKKKGRHY